MQNENSMLLPLTNEKTLALPENFHLLPNHPLQLLNNRSHPCVADNNEDENISRAHGKELKLPSLSSATNGHLNWLPLKEICQGSIDIFRMIQLQVEASVDVEAMSLYEIGSKKNV